MPDRGWSAALGGDVERIAGGLRHRRVGGAFGFPGEPIPFLITGATITVDGMSQAFTAALLDSCPPTINCTPRDKLIDLSGSGLDSMFVDRITISGISTVSSNFNAGFFSISEIELDGRATQPIPEPTYAVLFGVGALVVGGALRKKAVASHTR